MVKKNIKRKREQLKKNIYSKKNQSKQFFGIVITLAALLLLFIGSYLFFQSKKSFVYEGLSFNKEKFGQIPVFHYSYFFKDLEGNQYEYNLYLRNDPRKNAVPMTGEVLYTIGVPVYISINSTGLNKCPQSSIAIADLTSFLSDNLLVVKSGVPDDFIAKELNRTYATCDTHPDNVVILIKEGTNTIITKKNNCYVIEVANCEILPAIEKFKTQSVINAKSRNKLR